VAALISATDAAATDRMSASGAEVLFPHPGQVTLTAATGIPFLAIGEVAIGVTDGLAVGALVGITPVVTGFGARIRGVLIDRGTWRLSAVAPILLYPRTNLSGAPFAVGRATALYERVLPGDWRISLGLGVIGATTFARVARTFGATDYSDGAGGLHSYGSETPATAGLWGTISAGVIMPLGPRWSLFADAGVVTEGAHLAASDQIGGVPLVAAVGTCFRF
jgi:hypothetical protein